MANVRPELRRGRIIWATVRDRRGISKHRPLIILTPTDAIRDDEPLIAMALTTTFPDPPPTDHVPLPWHPEGRVATRLRKRSAAVLSWIVEVDVQAIITLYGDVPVGLMKEILYKLEA